MAGIYEIKPAFQRSLHGIEDWLVAHRVHPDTLTYGALALSAGGAGCLWLAPVWRWLLLLVAIVAVVRTALNALDGMVASRRGLARPWGEVLNEFSDRLADLLIFGSLAMVEGANHLLGALTVVVVLLTSFLGVLSRAAGGPRQHGGPMGKPDRMILLAIVAPLGLFLPVVAVYNWYLGIVLVGTLATLVLRLRVTFRDLQPRR